MLENLIQTLPKERAKLLEQELSILHRSAERFFAEPEDRALADVGDPQGVGGKTGQSATASPVDKSVGGTGTNLPLTDAPGTPPAASHARA